MLRISLQFALLSVRRSPDWMRDKAAVEDYKRKIKQQLMDQGVPVRPGHSMRLTVACAGMVRGQPKAGSIHGMHPYVVPGHLPIWSQHHHHPTLNRSHSTGSSNTDDEFSSGRSSSRTSDQYSPVRLQTGTLPALHSNAAEYIFSYPNASVSSSDPMRDPFASYTLVPQQHDPQHHQQQQQSHFDVVPSNFDPLASYPVTYQTQPYQPAQPQQALEQVPRVRQSMMLPSTLAPAQEQHVLYYFQRVRGFQASIMTCR